MKDIKVWIDIPVSVRMGWIHAINSDDVAIVDCIRNTMATSMFVRTPERLIALFKSLSDAGIEHADPFLWNAIYPALKKASRRFDFNETEIAELSKYMNYSAVKVNDPVLSDMYLALRSLLNSDVSLPTSVRKQVEDAFDKVNGDF